MKGHCFWILNDGTILEQSRHILAVVAAPEKFGETEESIQQTFEKYGQNYMSNFEGRAREEIMSRVIKRNNIRIRKYIHKHCQHWIIQLYDLTDERKHQILKWAKYVSIDGDPYADVIIHTLHDNSKIVTSLDNLAEEYCGSEKYENKSQSELARRSK